MSETLQVPEIAFGFSVGNITIASGTNIYFKSIYHVAVDKYGNAYVSFIYSENLINGIKKIDKNGNELWSIYAETGVVNGLAVDYDGQYIYVAMNYGTAILRLSTVNGAQIDGSGFPVSLSNGTNFAQLRYGADGYLYSAMSGAVKSLNAWVTKIDLTNGSIVWEYQLPQGDSGTMRSINTIDINSSGQVVIAAIKTGESEIDGIGEAVTCLNADGSLKFRALAGVRSGTGPICYGAVIMEDGTVFEIPNEGSLVKIVHPIGNNYSTYTRTELMPDPVYVNGFPYYRKFFSIMKSPDNKFLYFDQIYKVDLLGNIIWEYDTELITGDYSETGTMFYQMAFQPSRVSARRIDIAIRCGGEVNLGDITGVVR